MKHMQYYTSLRVLCVGLTHAGQVAVHTCSTVRCVDTTVQIQYIKLHDFRLKCPSVSKGEYDIAWTCLSAILYVELVQFLHNTCTIYMYCMHVPIVYYR